MSAGKVFSMSALVVSAFLAVGGQAFGQDAPLPSGVKAVWDMSKAHRDTTPTRERVCINGLWRWQPAKADATSVPAADWGFFKVPGCWPASPTTCRTTRQTVFPHPSWRDADMSGISSAWYQREIVVPKEWTDRRITLYAEYVNSSAAVFLDGKEIGTILFPAGELDLTAACRPGAKQLLTLRVKALPLKEVMLAYSDTNAAKRGERLGRPPRPLRRRLPDRRAERRAHHRRDGGHLRSQVGDHCPRRARPASAGREVPAQGGGLRRRAHGERVHERAVRRGGPCRRTRIVHGCLEARETLGHPHAGQRVFRAGLVDRRGRPGPRRVHAGAVRLPRVLDRRARLLPQRHAHLPLRRPARSTRRPAPRGRPTTPCARASSA